MQHCAIAQAVRYRAQLGIDDPMRGYDFGNYSHAEQIAGGLREPSQVVDLNKRLYAVEHSAPVEYLL
jgi:hypothetical protein